MKLVRLGWVFLALGFLVYFVVTRWDIVVSLSAQLALWQPILGLVLILAAKLAYVAVVHLTLRAVKAEAPVGEAFYAYSVSQLGKYIPGSIWQFVGRYDIYRRYGIERGQAVQIMLLENLLMLAIAGIVGLGALPTLLELVSAHLPLPLVLGAGMVGAIVASGVALAWPAARERGLSLGRAMWRHHSFGVRAAAFFFAMWILFGLSLYALLADRPQVTAFSTIALFSVSYIVGFVVVFAPAGFGVREAALTLGLHGIVDPETAFMLAVGHRLLYVAADVIYGLTALGWSGLNSKGHVPAG